MKLTKAEFGEKKIMYSTKLRPKTIAKLKRVAKANNLSAARVVEQLIEECLKEYKHQVD